jgi:MFS family permease
MMSRRAPLTKWRSILILAASVVLAMMPWFAASAAVPSLRIEYGLPESLVALLTSIVSLGFIAGTLAIALAGIVDRMDPRSVFRWCAAGGAVASAGALAFEPSSLAVVALRFLSGACMAGIYPLGMKIASGWADRDMGLLIGIITGSVTLGSASPYLVAAVGDVGWRETSLAVASCSFIAALTIGLVRLGPKHAVNHRFLPSRAFAAFRPGSLRLAQVGYFGHKWENYAMWAWIGAFLQSSFAASAGVDAVEAKRWGNLAAFAIIASGTLGCLAGGVLADRFGRTVIAITALGVSGFCCMTAGLLFGVHSGALLALCLIWGFAVVADSGQFSSCVIELSDDALAGTYLTVQTCIGYLITLPAIHLVGYLSGRFGWEYAFPILALGPLVSGIAMFRLRSHRDAAIRLAHGKR